MSGVSTPSPRLSRTIDLHGAAQPPKRPLVQLRPDLRARAPRQQPHALAGVAQREDEEPRASVLAGRRIAHHRAFAVVDLALLAGRRRDHHARLGGRSCRGVSATKRRTLAYRAVKPWSSTRSCQIAIALRPRPSASVDDLAVDLARARTRRAGRRTEVGGHRLVDGRFCRGVGGHLRRDGRFCRRPDSRGRRPGPDRNAGGPQVAAGRLAADTSRVLRSARSDQPNRPSARTCCCFCSSKTLLIPARDHSPSPSSTSRSVSRGGRFSAVDQWPVLGVHRGSQVWSSRLA